jgi:hypothetical protein
MKKTTKNGRISVRNRQAIKEPVAAFAKAHNLNTNLVMSSVLWTGERMATRMCPKALKALITLETVAAYRQELDRRAAYYTNQVNGMIRNSLPQAQRTAENIARVAARVAARAAGLSIPELKQAIQEEAGETAAA